MATKADLDAAFAELALEVEKNTAVDGSAIALMKGLKEQLDAALALSNPAAVIAQVKAISGKLGTDTQALADAVLANTPTEPPA